MLTTEFHPARQAGSQRLLMALHGLGDSVAGYRWLPEVLGLPWLNYLLVNAPDEYYGGYSWYDFAGDPGPGVCRSRELLFPLVDRQREQGFPAEQITLFGFSQGCLMVWEMGLRYPHRFAGLVGISGYAHHPEQAIRELSPQARQQRFLITHGRQDPMIPFGEVRRQVAFLQGAGLQVAWQEFDKPHTIAGEEEVGVIREFIRAGYGRPD
jgi:phospholipase/carboxylesterase